MALVVIWKTEDPGRRKKDWIALYSWVKKKMQFSHCSGTALGHLSQARGAQMCVPVATVQKEVSYHQLPYNLQNFE